MCSSDLIDREIERDSGAHAHVERVHGFFVSLLLVPVSYADTYAYTQATRRSMESSLRPDSG